MISFGSMRQRPRSLCSYVTSLCFLSSICALSPHPHNQSQDKRKQMPWELGGVISVALYWESSLSLSPASEMQAQPHMPHLLCAPSALPSFSLPHMNYTDEHGQPGLCGGFGPFGVTSEVRNQRTENPPLAGIWHIRGFSHGP